MVDDEVVLRTEDPWVVASDVGCLAVSSWVARISLHVDADVSVA